MSRATAILVARMGSTRLPGKSVMPILGEPLIGRMIERVRASALVDQIVIATSDLPHDDVLEVEAERLGVGCYRGSPEDVLDRVRGAAAANDADPIIELLGDNPLVHSDLIDGVLARFHHESLDSCVNLTMEFSQATAAGRRFPVGVRVHVCTRKALETSARLAPSGPMRENATSFMTQETARFRGCFVTADGSWQEADRPEVTFAVNYREDYELVRDIFESCYPGNNNFSIPDALRARDARDTK